LYSPEASDEHLSGAALHWLEILPPAGLGPDRVHLFEQEVADADIVSHVRFDIYPDGGVSRLRLFGHWDPD
jgi:allantoicase